ncbi:MAG: hypothetical protein IT370_35010 [Deltaproteobacteria bacterium]|nr:hypothetical protein [Deltaproteobacteria bacterium]
MARADTVHCPHCGGAVALRALAASTVCPYCRGHVAVPTWVQARVGGYQAGLRQAEAQALRAREAAAGARMARRMLDAPRFTLLAGLLIVLPPAATALAVMALARSGTLPMNAFVPLLVGLSTLVSLLGLAAFVLILVRRGKVAGGLALGAREVACPTCGGLNQLQPEPAGQACAFCSHALVPSATQVARVLADAAQLVQHERIVAEREKRRVTVATLERLADTLKVLAWVGLRTRFQVASKLAVATVALIILTVRDGSRLGTVSLPVGLGWCALVIVVVLVLAYTLARARSAALATQVFATLAAQFHGTVLTGRAGVTGWLDATWGGALALTELGSSTQHRGVALTVRGYHAMFELQPQRGSIFTQAQGAPRLTVFVAALLPVDALGAPTLPSTPAISATRDWLVDAGFELRADLGGLRAVAGPALVRRLAGSPTHLEGLAPILDQLAQVAQAAGAHPVVPREAVIA